ncbi:MAG TPA: glycerophosphodiester phosphodiesterase family protein [Candidatus Polarisedimenticolaceae bacterium]|nr:glycerophosphodiester phosphodiesterase family protein [Candidatus Polarisedimenticolaceae bacterium]
MLIVGHRGAAARAPENTAASLVAGLDAGADMIEIDVGLTSDGHVVVLHDTTVNRTTNGRGALASMTWDKASSLDAGSWFSKRFSSERLIDLDDALAIVRARVPIIVEIKAGARDRDTVDGVLACIARTGGFKGVTISSSAWELLERVRDKAPDADIALTVRSRERRDAFAWAKRIGASAFHPNYLTTTSGFIRRAHDAGLIVIPYTVNSVALMRMLIAAGADGIFTDDPSTMKRALARRRAPAPDGHLALGIDQGSGGTRAVLVNGAGSIVASHRVAVASTRRRDGSIVQDAEAIAESVVHAAEPLVERTTTSIAAAGLAVQRSSLVVWRRSDARPVTPVLSWRAGTPYEPSAELLRVEDRIERATGLTVRFPYGAVRLAALCAEEPEMARKLADGDLVAGPLGAFLAARLGGAHDAPCDPSLAQRTLAFDLAHGAFTKELAAVLGVPQRAWAPVAASVAPRGKLKLGRARIPLSALAGDVGAAARAALATDGRKKTGVIVLGTGGFVVVPTGTTRKNVPGLLTTLLWENGEGPRYAIEGTVHGLAAGLVQAGKLGGFESLQAPRIAARSGYAKRVPEVVAALEGTGTPDWEVRPRFEVEAGDFTPEEVIRGTIEDLAGRFGRIAALLRDAKALPETFVACGGLAAAPHLTTRIAERMGVTLSIDPRPDLTAAGAALLARDAG